MDYRAKRSKPPLPEDYDPVAPLTDEEIRALRPARDVFAELGIALPKMGRPKVAVPKQSVTVRFDPEVIDYFKAGGPGWQTRMNAVLLKEVRRKRA